MIFVAQILELNGGTTFLLRTCAAMQAAGHACAVLVLRPGGDAALRERLGRVATIIALGPYQRERGAMFRRQTSAFGPISWERLAAALAPFGTTLHVMGVFGLLLAARLAHHVPRFRVTAGVYHQNEFMFRDHALFSRRMLRLFRQLPPENLLFFNDLTRSNYARFHDAPGYDRALVAPIGIAVPATPPPTDRRPGRLIVSVGNLERFKTYNRHVIALLPELRTRFPTIRYDVYGSGDQHDPLLAQARALRVDDLVTFHGSLPYEELGRVWAAADLFVGSGTALIEAAAAGVPALIGIESLEQPSTYGFLSDIGDLSYNEYTPDVPLRPMAACIADLFGSDARWRAIADACFAKSRAFGVEHTVAGLLALAARARPTPALVSEATVARLFVELALLTMRDRWAPDTAFARRREQSYRP